MLFRLNIHTNEDVYLDFNLFHALESAHGKKMLKKARIRFCLIMAILAALVLLVLGGDTFSVVYAVTLLLVTLVYMLLLKKISIWSIKANIKRLKKIGRLPFTPVSTLEFYEDKVVEITDLQRTETGYGMIERICVVKDRCILVYQSSVQAFILPVLQVAEQVKPEELIAFLSEKCTNCANVEYY